MDAETRQHPDSVGAHLLGYGPCLQEEPDRSLNLVCHDHHRGNHSNIHIQTRCRWLAGRVVPRQPALPGPYFWCFGPQRSYQMDLFEVFLCVQDWPLPAFWAVKIVG